MNARVALGLAIALAGLLIVVDPVGRVSTRRLSGDALLVPVFGVCSSVIVLGEPLRWELAVGGAIVLAGLGLVRRSPWESIQSWQTGSRSSSAFRDPP